VGPKIHLRLPRLRRRLPNIVFGNHSFVPIPHTPPRPHLPSFVVTCLDRVIIFLALQPRCRSRATATSPAINHMASRSSLISVYLCLVRATLTSTAIIRASRTLMQYARPFLSSQIVIPITAHAPHLTCATNLTYHYSCQPSFVAVPMCMCHTPTSLSVVRASQPRCSLSWSCRHSCPPSSTSTSPLPVASSSPLPHMPF
jgi:hypothetical protein